ncbi:thioredoxin TrxC [Roseateles puraquae]|uniref:Thioredoxin TrxC n=1 Tax=Roseateles puraquae TaxID=431059 RepID=A0A254N5L3_9BURK|nr:thioredoxin TrxC [Roseateles puraquae]MDG0853450.1 thioredoxin TrxC [Roseateles puraquae]OWR03020.1 thioredoxin TrxC [Roseateles puraquae]
MLLVCPHCGTRNRVPEARLADDPSCGRCGQPVAPARPVVLGDADLSAYLQGTEAPVVVDFWAAWCGPCRAYAPHFEQLAAARPELRFVKVDSDAAPRASAALQIRSIPTTLLFVGGREVARQSGAMSSSKLGVWIDTALR